MQALKFFVVVPYVGALLLASFGFILHYAPIALGWIMSFAPDTSTEILGLTNYNAFTAAASVFALCFMLGCLVVGCLLGFSSIPRQTVE